MTIAMIVKLTAVAGQAEALGEVLAGLVVETRKEAGYRQYDLYRGSGDTWTVVEIWPDQAALDAHMQAPHMAAAGPKLAGLLASPPEVETCTPYDVAAFSN